MNQKPSERIKELVKNRSGVENYLTAIIQYLDEEYERNKTLERAKVEIYSNCKPNIEGITNL